MNDPLDDGRIKGPDPTVLFLNQLLGQMLAQGIDEVRLTDEGRVSLETDRGIDDQGIRGVALDLQDLAGGSANDGIEVSLKVGQLLVEFDVETEVGLQSGLPGVQSSGRLV